MPNDIKLQCCNTKIKSGNFYFLKDIKGFTARKIYVGKCRICGDYAVILFETRIKDNIVFVNQLNGIEAVKTLYREKKRIVSVFPDIKDNGLYGWIYGHNVQIKNKKGIVTQIRQYASDFKGNKSLVKKIINSK